MIRGVNYENVIKLLKFLKERNETETINDIEETINRADLENWSDERWTIDDNTSEY